MRLVGLASRAGIDVLGAVGAAIDATVIAAVDPAENVTGCCADDTANACADCGSNNIAASRTGTNDRTAHGAYGGTLLR